jgi:hypothetical protein
MNNVVHLAAVCCLVSVAAQSQESPSVEARWAAIAQCAAIHDDDARHACSDNVLRDAGLLPDAADAKASFGLQRPAPSAPRQRDDERLEVTLASVEQAGDGKLVLTTTDGAIWRQVESDTVHQLPVQGQTMKIAKKSLGGFMCEPSRYVAFRCFRIR